MALSKQAITNKILTWAKQQKHDAILVNDKEHEPPRKIAFARGMKLVSADLHLVQKGKEDLFCAEIKLTQKTGADAVSRWIFLSVEARKMGGELFIVVEKANEKEVIDILTSKQIGAEVLTVESL